jgi:transcriptional regulator with GAF, ATPase, and Fis domain
MAVLCLWRNILKIKPSQLKEWLSPVSIATYLGTIGSYIAFYKDFDALAVAFLEFLAVVLFLSNLYIYRRYARYKRYTMIDSNLHRLTHRTRDFIVELRLTTDRNEAQEKCAAATKGALTTAADIFTTITDSHCTASLMLERDGQLQTFQYCHQVLPERENKPSGKMPSGDGIAGQAFATGDVVVWGESAPSFKSIRPDHASFYRSGMCTPFKAGMKYAGLLNLDSLLENAFQKESHKQLAATLADQIGVIMECMNLWEDLNDA